MNVQITDRAAHLRTFWSEFTRVHSHVLWLGLLADAFGFENLFMACWRVRERILDIMEETTGGRVIFSVCKVGGLRRDVSNDTLQRILKEIDSIEAEMRSILDVFIDDYTVKKRLIGVGMLSKQDAHDLGAVGPTARGSGIPTDMRQHNYAAYAGLGFAPIVETSCDSYARTVVRIKECYQAFDLCRAAISHMPEGPVDVKVMGSPTGENFERLEQPRGEVVYYVKGNGTRNLDRFRVRTPTFANIPPLLKMLQGCELADVPVIVLTIDPCISCAER